MAEDQWGLITRRQASAAGIPPTTLKRLIREGALERVASAVYRLAGAPIPEHLDLRAAWLQLAPEIPAWDRRPEEGVVSHRSAAALFGLGHLPADQHEFTLPVRRQSRRSDVRLHRGDVGGSVHLRGLPVTPPSVIVDDLLSEREDPTAVAHVVADAIREGYERPGAMADVLTSRAGSFGLRPGDGLRLLSWLLDLVGDPDTARWMAEAREYVGRLEKASPGGTPRSVTGRARAPA